MRKRAIGKKAGILLFWLLLWQLAAVIVQKSYILVGPWETVQALVRLAGETGFWRTIAASAGRIACGFLAAFLAGILAGGLAWRFPFVRDLLEPVITLMRAVPVASFVILVLIWIGAGGLTLTISFLVVFPMIYQAMLTGLAAADPELLEMGQVFRLKKWKRLLYLYRPALMPSLLGTCRTALGMCWKSGVAAEVIGMPDYSIGAELYLAKIYFETADLFAWTAVIILLSVCFEKVFLWILKALGQPFGGLLREREAEPRQPQPVRLRGVSKSFEGKKVLEGQDLVLEPGGVYGLMAPSGAGKTTLLRILMGLEETDGGEITGTDKLWVTAAFQENRLCPELTARENAALAGGRPRLEQILPAEDLEKKAGELSGGMKRRVAVARAMAASGDLVILDEPFAGLDEATKEQTAAYVSAMRRGRTLLFTTHNKKDLTALGAAGLELASAVPVFIEDELHTDSSDCSDR